MSDIVTIPFGESAEDTAVLLLAAVEDLDLAPSVVTTGSYGNFYAPKEVAESAGVDYVDDDAADNPPMADVDQPQPEPEADAAFDPSTHNVDEVLVHLEENPDQREAVIAAEQQGKNRVTITESQE